MPDYKPRPPLNSLEILTAAAQTILWESNAEVVYLYGSGGRYFNKVDDPGTRSTFIGETRNPTFRGSSDFDIGIQTTDKEETFRVIGELALEGRIPRFIESDQVPTGDIRRNRGYWPAGHRISYAVHTDELHGRPQDRYILAE